MTINNKFNIGDVVYVVTDTEQHKCMVTALIITMSGILYEVSQASHSVKFYEFELSDTKDLF